MATSSVRASTTRWPAGAHPLGLQEGPDEGVFDITDFTNASPWEQYAWPVSVATAPS